MVRFALLPLLALLALAEDASISAGRIRADVKYLASDLLEGRGIGQTGGDLAAEYIADQFAKAGATPAGDDGTYFQKVPLMGIDPQPETRLSASANGQNLDFQWGADFVGADLSQQAQQTFDGQVVFVGHGIAAPEFHWDDYKGADVRGKILLLYRLERGKGLRVANSIAERSPFLTWRPLGDWP